MIEIGDGVVEVLATAGNNHLGGDDFDQRIMNYLIGEFKKAEGIDLSKDQTAVQRIKRRGRKKAKEKKFDECDQLIEAAAECLKEAHDSQMDVMQAEATGDDVELGFIMVHAQDHLMTTLLLKRYHWNTDRRISCVNKRGVVL